LPARPTQKKQRIDSAFAAHIIACRSWRLVVKRSIVQLMPDLALGS
jgi:hypothetical protein